METIQQAIVHLPKICDLQPYLPQEYGILTESWQHEKALQVQSFDISQDILFVYGSKEGCSAIDLRNRIFVEKLVPLDIRAAYAILESPSLLKEFNSFVRKRVWNFETITFLGAFLSDGEKDHCVSFVYNKYSPQKPPRIVPYEILDEGWRDDDIVPVYSKSFIERL